MLTRLFVCAAIPLCFAQADFQYQSTSRVTGGSLIQMMRFIPGGGALKEPQVSTVAIQGNRFGRRSKRDGEIIDLDKRTITSINFEKKTYSEVTFEQMKQALEQATAKAQAQAKPSPAAEDAKKVDLGVDADLKDTGKTRNVNGYDAHEVIMTMAMTASDPQSGAAGAMKLNSEMWIAKDVPGSGEVREFYARMAKELDWAPTGMAGIMNRPDIAKAMAKMSAESGKMEGTPVQQITKITIDGAGTPEGQSSQPAAPRPSVSDAIGGALGSKLGGFGGFGKKKKQDAPSADAPADTAAAGSSAGSGSLMEMTIDNTGFTTSGIDASMFQIPAGFKKVEGDLPGGRAK
jgi:hypothetical protein